MGPAGLSDTQPDNDRYSRAFYMLALSSKMASHKLTGHRKGLQQSCAHASLCNTATYSPPNCATSMRWPQYLSTMVWPMRQGTLWTPASRSSGAPTSHSSSTRPRARQHENYADAPTSLCDRPRAYL
ncbi:hypothetical protein AcV5_010079 [Taiwanofungus camphoratus]|nr:hypothetical protein AcV5_010079 [Antrodia cinnamomea]